MSSIATAGTKIFEYEYRLGYSRIAKIAASTPKKSDPVRSAATTQVTAAATPSSAQLSAASLKGPGESHCTIAESAYIPGRPGSTKSRPGTSPKSTCCAQARC